MTLADVTLKATTQLLLGTYGDNLEEDDRVMAFLMKNLDCPGIHLTRALSDMALALACAILHKKTGRRKPIECVGYSYRFERQQGQEDRLTVLLKREKRMWKTQPSPKRVAGNR